MSSFTTALAGILVTVGLGACASSPPTALREARATYHRAELSPARVEAPEEMDAAKVALGDAELAFKRHGDSKTTRVRAHQAQVKAQHAIELGQLRAAAKKDMPKEVVAPLPRKDEGPERQAEVERDDVLKAVRQFATVTDGPGRMVISIAADVAFATGSTEVSGAARGKLALIAAVLKEHPLSTITITGHADAVGSDDFNQQLSLSRAIAVRDVLMGFGLPAVRFKVLGQGADAPIASNDTPEGRAKNRRVEIQIDGMIQAPEGPGAPALETPRPAPAPKAKPDKALPDPEAPFHGKLPHD